jgi:hypothetical protein
MLCMWSWRRLQYWLVEEGFYLQSSNSNYLRIVPGDEAPVQGEIIIFGLVY